MKGQPGTRLCVRSWVGERTQMWMTGRPGLRELPIYWGTQVWAWLQYGPRTVGAQGRERLIPTDEKEGKNSTGQEFSWPTFDCRLIKDGLFFFFPVDSSECPEKPWALWLLDEFIRLTDKSCRLLLLDASCVLLSEAPSFTPNNSFQGWCVLNSLERFLPWFSNTYYCKKTFVKVATILSAFLFWSSCCSPSPMFSCTLSQWVV